MQVMKLRTRRLPVLITLFLLLALVDFSPVLAREVVVAGPDESIQAAIDAAGRFDVIIIRNGTYVENIMINKPLTIRSEHGGGSTTIEAKDPAAPVVWVLETGGVFVNGITVTGSIHSGLFLKKTRDSVLSDNVAVENGTGILLQYSDGNTISGNLASDNITGLNLEFSDENTVKENKIDSNRDKGIILNSSNKNILRDNSANSNYWNGITLWASRNNIIEENEVVKNTYAIVLSNSKDNEIRGNRTMRRLAYILPVALVYMGIFFYLVERKLFILYFKLMRK